MPNCDFLELKNHICVLPLPTIEYMFSEIRSCDGLAQGAWLWLFLEHTCFSGKICPTLWHLQWIYCIRITVSQHSSSRAAVRPPRPPAGSAAVPLRVTDPPGLRLAARVTLGLVAGQPVGSLPCKSMSFTWTHISIALFQSTAQSRFIRLVIFACLHTVGRCCHARCQLLIRSNLGFSISLKDTSTCS